MFRHGEFSLNIYIYVRVIIGGPTDTSSKLCARVRVTITRHILLLRRTAYEGTTLEQITKTLKALSSREEKMFTELSELGKTQSDQVTRTVAYSTNQVMKLHQDVMSMSNVLMAGNINGGISSGPWNNSSVTSTVSLMCLILYTPTLSVPVSYRM